MTVYTRAWYGNAVYWSIKELGNKPTETPENQRIITENPARYFPVVVCKMDQKQLLKDLLPLGFEPGGREFAPTRAARTGRPQGGPSLRARHFYQEAQLLSGG
jgi:hypothetical protein